MQRLGNALTKRLGKDVDETIVGIEIGGHRMSTSAGKAKFAPSINLD